MVKQSYSFLNEIVKFPEVSLGFVPNLVDTTEEDVIPSLLPGYGGTIWSGHGTLRVTMEGTRKEGKTRKRPR